MWPGVLGVGSQGMRWSESTRVLSCQGSMGGGGGDDSEHPGIEVQNPSQRVWGLGAHLCAPQIRPSVNCV